MAGEQIQSTDDDFGPRATFREDAALCIAPAEVQHVVPQLLQLVRLLLLCHRRQELKLVGLVHFHNLTPAAAGERLRVPENRVRDTLESLRARLDQVEAEDNRQRRLRQLDAKQPPAPKIKRPIGRPRKDAARA